MKDYCFHIILLTLFLLFYGLASGQNLNQDNLESKTSHQKKENQKSNKPLSLRERLQNLEKDFDVHFLYETQLLKGKSTPAISNDLDLESQLQILLDNNQLAFVKIASATYAIIRKKKAGLVHGRIKEENEAPLIGATIRILDSYKGTTTDLNGAYQLELPEGEFQLEASYVGFKTCTKTVQISSGEDIQLDFQLSDFTTLEQIIVAGSRAKPSPLLEKTVPADIVEAKKIVASYQTEMAQALQYTVPSFHSTQQTISDGTDHVDPATLRGLGPDQFLVLINGKRRHSSAQVNINGTIGRGTVGTDLNAIPASAIERIEILRDGAAAQYGSDAIAGLINFVLKENTNFLDINVQTGISQLGDGEIFATSSNYGFSLGEKGGFMNLSFDFRKKGHVNRSGNYTGPIFGDSRDLNPDSVALFFNQTGFKDAKVMSVGSAATLNSGFFLNSTFPIDEKTEIYTFGGFNYRRGDSGGFYRFPYQKTKQSGLYEFGFSPKIKSDIFDRSFTLGVKAKRREWEIDLSNSLGSNSIGFTVYDSNNASLGLASPSSAYAGGYAYTHNITNLDVRKKISKPISLNIAFGGEFRLENYKQKAGEEVSWADYGALTIKGQPKEAGFQLFPGFRPENAINKYRFNNGLYFDLESELTSKLLLAWAGRYELYSDFGSNFSWKFAGRYKIKDQFSLRGTINTGFRAPSMPQIYSSSHSIQFINVGEELRGVSVSHFNNISPITGQFGIMPIKAETSRNLSLGFASQLLDNLSFTLDGYHIAIKDRIVITGLFASENDIHFAEILDPIDVNRAQFFTNAIDTRTQGIDFSIDYKKSLRNSVLSFNLAGNFTQTEIVADENGEKVIKTSELLRPHQNILFNREEISRIEVAQPRSKVIFTLQYNNKKLSLLLRNTHFGSVKYVHPEDGDSELWVLNSLNQTVESRDQVFSAKWITDLNCAYSFSNKIRLSIGINNLFNVYPDRHLHSANIGHGLFPYSRRVQQFGVLGAFWFTKFNIKL